MASAYYREDRGHWIADFRALWSPPGKHSKLRIPSARVPSPASAPTDAQGFADEVERYCRLLEAAGTGADPADVAHAKRLGAISESQAEAIFRGAHQPKRGAPAGRMRIRDAALSHPSSKREDLAQQVQHLKYLDAFIAFANIQHQADVTVDAVERWVVEMKKRGWQWDSRRHAMLYLRRAAQMATRDGIPDQLAGLRLDQRERRRQVIRAGSMEQLVDLLISDEIDARTRAALALFGCVGLRPSEVIRLDPVDLVDDAAHIGAEEAKNDPSERWLPLPRTVLGWVRKHLGRRKLEPIIQPIGPRRKARYSYTGLRQWLAPILTKHMGQPLSTKSLRKTFATWSAEFLAPMDHERWMGHKTQFRADVTERSYMKRYQIEQMRPASVLIERALAAEIRKAKAKKKRKSRRRKAG